MTCYTLIAHKPESAEYCGGHRIESYDGDFHLSYAESLDELASDWKRFVHANRARGRYEEDYDITLLINGQPLSDLPRNASWLGEHDDPSVVPLVQEAYDWLSRLTAEVDAERHQARVAAEQAKQAKDEADAKAQQARKEAKDRAEYERLQALFGGNKNG
jgi:hypothetical protein